MSLLDRLLGKPLASSAEDEQKVGVFAGLPMLGLDGLSSAAYGPEAALTLLLPLGLLGLRYIGPITLVLLGLLAVLFFSYRQTIAAYPNGGGSYTVAKENLGVNAGLLAAAALLLDYILNVAVGISAGIGALVSAVPALHPHILGLCLATLFIVAIVNLRGIRESGTAFALPTYLFVGSLGLVLVIGLFKALTHGGHPSAVVTPPLLPVGTAAVSIWLLMRAFAAGCTAMTGVEAVSNGVSAFRAPAVKHAQNTLFAIVAILGLLLGGIAYLAHAYGIGAIDPDKPEYQSIISQLTLAVVGRNLFYYITIGSVLAVLALSANTSFADFPRLCRLIASDDYLPHAFSNRGRRLVYTMGIVILTALSAVLLIAFGGITDRLIPLFAVGAFLAFTMSQAGMVQHWRKQAQQGAGTHSRVALIVNAVGAITTAIALCIVLATKFVEGAWITALLIPALLMMFHWVKRHYAAVHTEIRYAQPIQLDDLAPPLVVVPIKDWTVIAEKAVRFALRLSPDIILVHVSADETNGHALRRQLEEFVDGPLRTAGRARPRLEILPSPFRRLFHPLLAYIDGLKLEHPDRLIAVIVPELVESRWYEYLLHNQRATGLKAALLFRGDRRVVVISVPWYLHNEQNVLPTDPHRPGEIASNSE